MSLPASATAPTGVPARPDLPLKFVGGDPSLDLVNTVDWTARGPVDERLVDYERLTRWGEEAGVLDAATAARLRRRAVLHPVEARAAHAEALRLRGALHTLVAHAAGAAVGTAADTGGSPTPPHALRSALVAFNATLGAGLRELGLRVEGGRFALAWPDAGAPLALPLWRVARAGATLLASEEAARLRVCGAPDCGWVYVDRSRNGFRRWCQMEVCGTQEKSRRRAARARNA
jgi:predicted RNA-binding Zn ribbon-like protein